MIILSQTTDILEVKMGGAKTTNEAQCFTSWRDITTTSFSPDKLPVNTNGSTPVSVAGSPAASTQRVVDLLNIYNADTVTQTITVQFNANGTRYVMISASLATGESLVYQEGSGWSHLNASGAPIISTGITAINGTTAEITATTAGSVVTLSLPTALTFTGKTVTGGTFSSPILSGTLTGSGTIGGSTIINTSGSITGGDISGTTGTFTAADDAFGFRIAGATGRLRFQGYVAANTGATIGALNTVENAYQTLSLYASTIYLAPNGTPAATITSTGLNNTVIGATTPAAGSFTTLGATGTVSTGGVFQAKNGATNIGLLGSGTNIGGNVNDLVVYGQQAGNILIYPNGALSGTFSPTGLAVTGNVSATNTGSTQSGTFTGNSGTGAYTVGISNTATSGDNLMVGFFTDASVFRGNITYNRAGGLIAYNTSSDRRAKMLFGEITNSGSIIDGMKVYDAMMKGATQHRPMFVADELMKVAPYAVIGEPDAVNKDGSPKYQQVDASSVVPLLVAELKSLRARVAQLEAK